jgi:hypothetical protein
MRYSAPLDFKFALSNDKADVRLLKQVVVDEEMCKSNTTMLTCIKLNIQGYSKSSIHFQKFILQKLLTLNPCPVYEWKGNLSKFLYRWSEAAHHWGCGCCYLWHAATCVGRAGLSIWHLPHHTWGSHRVRVRCENNIENSPFSLYTAHHHMFNSTCKINV